MGLTTPHADRPGSTPPALPGLLLSRGNMVRDSRHRGPMPQDTPPSPHESTQRFWMDGIEMVDDGPPHNGPLCFGPTGNWLCRQRADNGHSDHAPYTEGEYLRPAQDGA